MWLETDGDDAGNTWLVQEEAFVVKAHVACRHGLEVTAAGDDGEVVELRALAW